MKKVKKIGILGGMGHEAGVYAYQKIIQIMQQKYGAVQDTDFPQVVLYGNPLNNFTEQGITNYSSVESQVLFGVKQLESMGADTLLVACNTVHVFSKKIGELFTGNFIDIIQETVNYCKESKLQEVGVLGSSTTKEEDLYGAALWNAGIESIYVSKEQQSMIDDIILHVMSGMITSLDTILLKKIILDLYHKGAQEIVLGCTELPLVLKTLTKPHINPMTLGVTKALSQYMNTKPKEV